MADEFLRNGLAVFAMHVEQKTWRNTKSMLSKNLCALCVKNRKAGLNEKLDQEKLSLERRIAE
jgi:hypothetical protein